MRKPRVNIKSCTLEEQDIIKQLDGCVYSDEVKDLINDSMSQPLLNYANSIYSRLLANEKLSAKNRKNGKYKYMRFLKQTKTIETLKKYFYFTDISDYELNFAKQKIEYLKTYRPEKIKKFKIKKFKKTIQEVENEMSSVQQQIKNYIEYPKIRDKFMSEWLAKGNKPTNLDLTLNTSL